MLLLLKMELHYIRWSCHDTVFPFSVLTIMGIQKEKSSIKSDSGWDQMFAREFFTQLSILTTAALTPKTKRTLL